MNYRFVLFFLIIIGCPLVFSFPDGKQVKDRKEQEISFDEIIVHGKHHFSDEVVRTVEQDKVLDSLLEVPRDFKDRVKMSSKRN